MTSRLTNGLMVGELPISRQNSTAWISALISAGSEKVSATISTGSDGFGPVIRNLPRLAGRARLGSSDHEPGGGEKCATSGVVKGNSASRVCRLGVASDGSLFQKKVASPPPFRGISGV